MKTFADAYLAYLKKYDTPHNDFHINLARIFVGCFFVWKGLSRDFGFMGIVPSDFFYYYPIQLYPANYIVLTTGVPGLMELVTFHWIHWITGFPSESVLTALQFVLVSLALLMAIVGRGPYRIFAAATYIVASYLWGFIFLSGQEIDAVMIYFGLLLVLCIVNFDDVPVWRIGSIARKPANLEAGRSFSALLLVFVVYYGLSGYNKIADLSIADWFRYNLAQDIDNTLSMQHLGNNYGAPFPELFSYLKNVLVINYILVPLVYISHITVFLVFFVRKHVLKFAIFYTGFHFVTASTSIAFTGYIFVWWILLDWRRILVGSVAREGELGAS